MTTAVDGGSIPPISTQGRRRALLRFAEFRGSWGLLRCRRRPHFCLGLRLAPPAGRLMRMLLRAYRFVLVTDVSNASTRRPRPRAQRGCRRPRARPRLVSARTPRCRCTADRSAAASRTTRAPVPRSPVFALQSDRNAARQHQDHGCSTQPPHNESPPHPLRLTVGRLRRTARAGSEPDPHAP
jgi:hypothetical protein